MRHLGVSGAGFTTDNRWDLDHSGVLRPDAGVTVYAFSSHDRSRMTVSLTFASESAALDRRSRREQEEAVRAAAIGEGCEIPALLGDMHRAEDFSFASTEQVVMPGWSRGPVVLLGDAGYCAAPTSGMGTSQALLGARALARALHATPDHRSAFTEYERVLRPTVEDNQRQGVEAAAQFGGR